MAEVDEALVNRFTWKIPNALALVGSRHGDDWNAMTASWITQLSMDPVLIGIAVDNTAVTHRLISAGGSFTLNLWSATDTRPFVKFSKPASLEHDGERSLLNGREIVPAPSGAPVFVEAIAWADCVVRRAVDFGTHTLFAGELTAAEIRDDEGRAAAMSDTRMKYGGVKRH